MYWEVELTGELGVVGTSEERKEGIKWKVVNSENPEQDRRGGDDRVCGVQPGAIAHGDSGRDLRERATVLAPISVIYQDGIQLYQQMLWIQKQ